MKGLIALDIDGTITHMHHPISLRVIDYFEELHRAGYIFAFITGRNFLWGHEVLKALPISYYLSVNNGAVILSMPDRQILSRYYLDRALFSEAAKICAKASTDFVIYTGYEGNDLCYFRPDRLSQQLRDYLERRTKAFGENWIAVKSFEDTDLPSIASIKCFGTQEAMSKIAVQFEQALQLHVPVIRDPFNMDHYVAQATHPSATKGAAIALLKERLPKDAVVIAAGDDLNDISLLEAADIKIAMATAPDALRAYADYIAPPAEEEGIIAGLTYAIQNKITKD